MENNEILTTKEAATYLKITEKTMLKLINTGKIRAFRVGNVFRVKKSELEEDLRTGKK